MRNINLQEDECSEGSPEQNNMSAIRQSSKKSLGYEQNRMHYASSSKHIAINKPYKNAPL